MGEALREVGVHEILGEVCASYRHAERGKVLYEFGMRVAGVAGSTNMRTRMRDADMRGAIERGAMAHRSRVCVAYGQYGTGGARCGPGTF